MLINGDDICIDVSNIGMCFSMFVYIRAHFRFVLIGGNLTAWSMGSLREIGGGIQIPKIWLQALLPFPATPARMPLRPCLQASQYPLENEN